MSFFKVISLFLRSHVALRTFESFHIFITLWKIIRLGKNGKYKDLKLFFLKEKNPGATGQIPYLNAMRKKRMSLVALCLVHS